jgi:hypothetical protein
MSSDAAFAHPVENHAVPLVVLRMLGVTGDLPRIGSC